MRLSFIIFFLKICLFILDGGGEEGEEERVLSKLCAKCGAQCGVRSRDSEIMTLAEPGVIVLTYCTTQAPTIELF